MATKKQENTLSAEDVAKQLEEQKAALEKERKAIEDEKAVLEKEREALEESAKTVESAAALVKGERERLEAEKAELGAADLSAAELEAAAEEMLREAKKKKAVEAASRAGVVGNAETVVCVYCKLPAGISFPMGGDIGNVVLNGSAHAGAVAGHGVTSVDKALWAGVKSKYGKMAVFANDTVFDSVSREKGDDEAKERKDVVTGLEGVDPKNPGGGIKPDDGK